MGTRTGVGTRSFGVAGKGGACLGLSAPGRACPKTGVNWPRPLTFRTMGRPPGQKIAVRSFPAEAIAGTLTPFAVPNDTVKSHRSRSPAGGDAQTRPPVAVQIYRIAGAINISTGAAGGWRCCSPFHFPAAAAVTVPGDARGQPPPTSAFGFGLLVYGGWTIGLR